MNTRTLSFDFFRGLLPALVFLGLLTRAQAATPTIEKSNITATGAAIGSAGTTNAANKQAPIEIPISQFTIPSTVAEGRNPFFPDSIAIAKASASATSNTVAKVTAAALDLKGVSGTGTKRYALINNRTFEVGEEADVTIGNTRTKAHVHCISIREDSVTVEVDGTRQELKLRSGI